MGVENLIDAATLLRSDLPNVQIMIAGRGPISSELERRISGAGLQESVRLLGFVSDLNLPLAYRAADLTVVPTVALEGFGLVAAESLATGTPAMVTPVGGLPEVVRRLCPELVLTASNILALVEGFRNFFGNRARFPDEQDIRMFARENFDWRRVADAVARVYACALA